MPATAEEVGIEIASRIDGAVNDAIWGELAKNVGEYLSDGVRVLNQLIALDAAMQVIAGERLGAPINPADAGVRLSTPRGPGVKQEAYLQNLLSIALARNEEANGFVLGTTAKYGHERVAPLLITGFVPPDSFRADVLGSGRPFKDPTVPGFHGEYTHRIQWYCIMTAGLLGFPLGRTWADFYRWVGTKTDLLDFIFKDGSWETLGLWDALFDRNNFTLPQGNGPYDTDNPDDFRSPENLMYYMTGDTSEGVGALPQAAVELPLLSSFLTGRLNKRADSRLIDSDATVLRNYVAKHRYGNPDYASLGIGEQAEVDRLIAGRLLTP